MKLLTPPRQQNEERNSLAIRLMKRYVDDPPPDSVPFSKSEEKNSGSHHMTDDTPLANSCRSYLDGSISTIRPDGARFSGLPTVPYHYSGALVDAPPLVDSMNEGIQNMADLNEISELSKDEDEPSCDERIYMNSPPSSTSLYALISPPRGAKKKLDIDGKRASLSKTAEAIISPTRQSAKKRMGRSSFATVGESPVTPSESSRRHGGFDLSPRTLSKRTSLTSPKSNKKGGHRRRHSSAADATTSSTRDDFVDSWVPCMSRYLGLTKEPQTLRLRQESSTGSNSNRLQGDGGVGVAGSPLSPFSPSKHRRSNALVVESMDPEQQQWTKLASMQQASGCSHRGGGDQRILRDNKGNQCAIVLRLPKDHEGHHRFKICGERPMRSEHRRNVDTGLYTWATVKNTGGIVGVQFSMKLRGAGESSSGQEYVTEAFGPSLFHWSTPRGYVIRQVGGYSSSKNMIPKGSDHSTTTSSRTMMLPKGSDHSPTGSKNMMIPKGSDHSVGSAAAVTENACARLTYLSGSRALTVGRNVDLCLMTSFAAIIDEMVEHRMR